MGARRGRRRDAAGVVALVVVLAAAAGCSDATDDEVALPVTGGCGEAFLWAASESGDVAVTVDVEGRDRAGDEPTSYALADPAVTVRVVRGRDLTSQFCTDLPQGAVERSEPVTTARGRVELDPPGLVCGDAEGQVELRGVVADDGTRLAPVAFTTDQIGCYAG